MREHFRPKLFKCQMSRCARDQTATGFYMTPVLITSKFDDDSMENEQGSIKTPFSHFKSMGHF